MITQVYLLPSLAQAHGLHGGKLQRLNKVVVLAGPNGSGKTRYLRLIQEVCAKFEDLINLASDLDSNQHVVADARKRLKTADNHAEISKHQERLRKSEQRLQNSKEASEFLQHTFLSPSYSEKRPAVIPLNYPSDSEQISDARSMSPAAFATTVQATKKVGFNNVFVGMHAYCTQIAQTLYHSEHPQAMGVGTISQQRQDAAAFNNILRALMDGEIGFVLASPEVLPTFRGRPLKVDELSTGERILLTWAISLHQQKRALSSAILLIDEPEIHLHHDACIRALTKLRDEVLGPEGQIWLATHSVPLLAWGGLDSVHFVKDGAIEFAGNNVTSVVESLLGGKEGRDRLATFLSDADEIAFMEFAAQCILPAGVADAKTGDKQQSQFVEVLRHRQANQPSLRILDFSAGKGRFASALRERFATGENTGLKQRIEYFAYNDPRYTEPEARTACQERIAALGQLEPAENYYWESLSKLTASHGGTIHLVILCNVLHEIEPENWLNVFRDINALLAQDGAIVIMEDLLPPVGELPNKRGYLLLDEFGLGLLFNAPNEIKRLQKHDGRLMAVEISKPLVARVSNNTREAALSHLQRDAKEQVRRLREQALEAPSHRLGREHAHFSMLYTNASLALEVLK